MVFDPNWLLQHWGYFAIFAVVILGNMGLPFPEETVLVLAGYLVWDGQLRLPIVLGVGIFSAVLGDNLGYWMGRGFGRRAIERYGHWIFVTPERLDATAKAGIPAIVAPGMCCVRSVSRWLICAASVQMRLPTSLSS